MTIVRRTTETDSVSLMALQKATESMVPTKSWPSWDGSPFERKDCLSASEMTKCLRQSWFAKLGNTGAVAFSGNGFTDRGDSVERWIVERLEPIEKLGYKLEYVGGDQRTFYDPATRISGTPDGLMTTPTGEKVLLEFKSIDPRANRNKLPKKAHVMQVQVNMHLLSLCLGIVVDEARLIYIDASDYRNQEEFVVTKHGDYWENAVSRAETMWGAADAANLDPEGVKTGDCDQCPFTKWCSHHIEARGSLIKAGEATSFFDLPESDDLTNEEVSAIVAFLEIRNTAAALEEKAEEAKNEAKAICLNHGGQVVVGGTVLTVAVQAGKEALDTKALKASGIDLSSYMKYGAPYAVMRVK